MNANDGVSRYDRGVYYMLYDQLILEASVVKRNHHAHIVSVISSNVHILLISL